MVLPDHRKDNENTSKAKGPTKRTWQSDSWSASQQNRKGVIKPVVDENSEVVKKFRVFQSELDARHDKHERLVKLSRDVTIESKRTIFLLHRIAGEEDNVSIIKEAQEKIEAVQSNHLLRIARELEGEDPFLFQRAVSPGFQEYVEAVLFLKYIAEKRLMGLGEVRGQLVFRVPAEDCAQTEDSSHPTLKNLPSEAKDAEIQPKDPPTYTPLRTLTLNISPMDYILGIADFTGELMRMCINSIGAGDTDTPFILVAFMRELYDNFRLQGNQPGREFIRKLSVMRQSVSKVENACYMLRVRGSEIPEHMLLDAISSLPDVDSGQTDY